MRIVFRVDSSYKIGTGHVMRCLTLAAELKKHGCEIEFICRELEGNLISFIESKEYPVHKLAASTSENENYCFHASWLECHWQEDATQCLLLLKDADWVVVDHYAIDEKWESIIHPLVGKIMVIDDLADRKHVCDLLLDQNYYSDAETRYNDLVEPDCHLLLSPKYALLRDEFAYARARLNRYFGAVKKVLVFFSGVDANNDTGKALNAIQDFDGEVIVIAGNSNKNYPALEQFCAEHNNFRLFKSVVNMAELMGKVDVAIGGGGATSWERAAMGLATLAWPIAENQVKILYDLNQYGAVKLTSPERLNEDLKNLKSWHLQEMSKKGMELCDGEGAIRVANKLASL